MYNDNFLAVKLQQRAAENAFRTLQTKQGFIDFCSNDYIGIATNNLLQLTQPYKTGSSGSRLLAGNYALIEEAEAAIANFHATEAAIIYNSGYDANLGLLSCVPQANDSIVYDFLSHTSIRDGIKLSAAAAYSFLHNDMNDLERRLQQLQQNRKGEIFIVTESVFSMDGVCCPINELVQLATQYKAHLIIDEAHATGVIGNKGEGLVQQQNQQQQVFARIITFGKALGCHGAVVVGSQQLKNYLVNFSRSLQYTTALPEHAVAIIKKTYDIFPELIAERQHLQTLINAFSNAIVYYPKKASLTAIQAIIIGGNTKTKQKALTIQQHGFDVRPILYPTVPRGKERLRIVLHSFNTVEQVNNLLEVINC
jgi:8-amino-7-oxononanoate synthase